MIDLIIEKYIKPALIPTNPIIKKIKPVRIKIKGTDHFITTVGKKTIWKRKGDAVNALWCHLQYPLDNIFKYESFGKYIGPDNKAYTYEQKQAVIKQVKDEIKNELVEFVEIGTEQVDIKQ